MKSTSMWITQVPYRRHPPSLAWTSRHVVQVHARISYQRSFVVSSDVLLVLNGEELVSLERITEHTRWDREYSFTIQGNCTNLFNIRAENYPFCVTLEAKGNPGRRSCGHTGEYGYIALSAGGN